MRLSLWVKHPHLFPPFDELPLGLIPRRRDVEPSVFVVGFESRDYLAPADQVNSLPGPLLPLTEDVPECRFLLIASLLKQLLKKPPLPDRR